MINFKEVIITQFTRAKNITYQLDIRGLCMIKGRNGSGKTTIVSAFYWCLTGEPLKKNSEVEPWESYRDKEYRGVKVSVVFSKGNDEYIVHRHKNYKDKTEGYRGANNLIITKNNEVVMIKDKKEVQQYLYNVLEIKNIVLKHTLIFGQKLTRLLQEKGPEQKKIFEEAFDIKYLPKAKELATKELDKAKEELKEVYIRVESSEKLINNIKSSLNSLESEYQLLVKRYKKEKERLLAIAKKQSKLGDERDLDALLTKKEKELLAVEKSLRKLMAFEETSTDISRLDTVIAINKNSISNTQAINKKLRGKIEELKASKHCPLCGSKVTPKHLANEVGSLLKEIKLNKARLSDLKAEQESLKKERAMLEEKANSEKSKGQELRIKQAKYQSLNKEIRAIQTSIHERNSNLKEAEGIKDKIAKLKKPTLKGNKTYVNLKIKLAEYEEELSKYLILKDKIQKRFDTYNWVISDPLSNKGIKAFIFNQRLPQINEALTKYSNIWGYEIIFGIDLDSGNKDFYAKLRIGNNTISYEDLSGGQQQIVDICIAFACHDVIASDNFNLLILDEVFESLDDNNIELVEELISQKAKDKSIHLITHRSSFKPQCSQVVKIVNYKGIILCKKVY